MSAKDNEWLEVIAKVLLRCWIFGFATLMIWFGFFMVAPTVIYGLHGSMFDLTRSQLSVIHYCGMGLTKLAVGLFFFIPWVAIRMVLKKAKD
jgi:hypothetical protein